jgi:negative regulator of flagellin synthesis FlgM
MFQETVVATKIGGLDSSPVQVSTGRTVKRAGTSDSEVKSSSVDAKADTQITDSARKLAALEQTVQDLPAIDEARVQQVSAKLANGSYKVDAGRIADKLLRSEHDLVGL